MVFPDRPDCLLLYVPEGMKVALPEIASPFDKAGASEALTKAGLRFRITESVPGRWTTSVVMMKSAEKAERAQVQKLREASMIALERGGTDLAKNRAEAIAKKHEVDERIREVKNWIGRAKSNLKAGRGYEEHRYRRKERELRDLQGESLALQNRLTELRKQEKEENAAAQEEENERFRRTAYRILPREVFERIEHAAAEEDEERVDG